MMMIVVVIIIICGRAAAVAGPRQGGADTDVPLGRVVAASGYHDTHRMS